MKYINYIIIFILLIVIFIGYNKINQLEESVTILSEEKQILITELSRAKEVESDLKQRQSHLNTAINKYAKKSSKIDKEKVIQDLTEIRDDLQKQSEKLDSITVNYPNRVDEDLINSLKYKLSL